MSTKMSISAAVAMTLIVSSCDDADVFRPPKDDSERGWSVTPIGGHPDLGFILSFGGDADDDYLAMRCTSASPQNVFITVFRFRDAPYGRAEVSNEIKTINLDSVPRRMWSNYWKNPSYHQFVTDFQSMDGLLDRDGGALTFVLASGDQRRERSFPLKGVCKAQFEDACHRVWVDPSATQDRSFYLRPCLPAARISN